MLISFVEYVDGNRDEIRGYDTLTFTDNFLVYKWNDNGNTIQEDLIPLNRIKYVSSIIGEE